MHTQLFKCEGAVTAGREQCSLGHPMGTGGGAFVCGPKVNNSEAPPSPKPPASTAAKCPVPFGLTGGSVEPGTDHARAGNTGSSVHELTCKPWCLFVRAMHPTFICHSRGPSITHGCCLACCSWQNLTADIGERDDLGKNPVTSTEHVTCLIGLSGG